MLPMTGVMLHLTVLTVPLLTNAPSCCVCPSVSVGAVVLMLTETKELRAAVRAILQCRHGGILQTGHSYGDGLVAGD